MLVVAVEQEEVAKYDKICEEAYVAAKKETAVKNTDWLDSPWPGFFEGKDPMKIPSTGCSEDVLRHVGQSVSTPPDNFVIHGGILLIITATTSPLLMADPFITCDIVIQKRRSKSTILVTNESPLLFVLGRTCVN